MRSFSRCFFALLLTLPLSGFGSTLPESGPNFRFAIDTIASYLGAEVELSIRNVSEPPKPGVGKGTAIGSFSFLISYDASQLELAGVRRGKILIEQGWENLIIIQPKDCSPQGEYAGLCTVRISANAEIRFNNRRHPHLTRQSIGEWLVLRFKIKDDCTLSGQILPISWHWRSCYDNRLMDFPENRVWMVDSVISLSGHARDLSGDFPIDLSNCDTLSFAKSNVKAERGITFINGGIGVPNPDGCNDFRGDLNLNGLQYEIADYVLYQNYFLYGDSVLFSNPQAMQAQIAASDVNGDGRTLKVADLVYLARVIMGENNPLPKPVLDTLSDSAYFNIIPTSRGLIVSTLSKQDIGGVFLRLKSGLPFGTPSILDTAVNLELAHNFAPDEIRILLSPRLTPDSSRIPRYKRQVLLIPYRGETLDSFEIQASTYNGRELPVAGTFYSPPPLPSLENCPTVEDTIWHGETYSVDFNHSREGEANVRYILEYGPGTIDSITGVYTAENICPPERHGISVLLLAGSGGPALVLGSCRFYVFVLDHAPSILCPPNTQVVMGRPYEAQTTAFDPDPADTGNLTFSLVSGPVGLTVSSSGFVQWTPTIADIGPHQICIRATDLCGASGECCYIITVVEGAKFRIAIDTVHGEQGADVEVAIRNLADAADPTLLNGQSIGGFSFLLSYDCACLQFLSARKGALLVEQGWEFFTYRFGAVGNGNCGSGCPSCLIRIVGIADVNDGGQPNWARENQGEWAVLKFRTTHDRTLGGQICPISWFWFDCTDNTVSDSTGERVWVVDSLYTAWGTAIDLAATFPTNVSACTTTVTGKPQPKKYLIFCNGGIQLPTPPEVGDRGDLNLNGIGYELADFVLFKNYFVYGPEVLSSDPALRQRQIYASDVNGDGLPLDLADLVTMARVITGDPNPLPTGQPQVVVFSFTKEGQNLVVSTTSAYELGGIFLRFNFSGTVGLPFKLDSAASMEFAGTSDSSQLRVLLVSSEKDAKIPAGTQRVLSIPFDSMPVPIEVSASTYYGFALPTSYSVTKVMEESQRQLPENFGISQNFPNPFNPSTSFTLSLPKSGRYAVRIYNLAGQVVRTFEGEAPAGRQTLTWDGTDQKGIPVSSGIYFYKVEANGFSETKKMILIR